jgi:hypothetical protein
VGTWSVTLEEKIDIVGDSLLAVFSSRGRWQPLSCWNNKALSSLESR